MYQDAVCRGSTDLFGYWPVLVTFRCTGQTQQLCPCHWKRCSGSDPPVFQALSSPTVVNFLRVFLRRNRVSKTSWNDIVDIVFCRAIIPWSTANIACRRFSPSNGGHLQLKEHSSRPNWQGIRLSTLPQYWRKPCQLVRSFTLNIHHPVVRSKRL